MATTWQEILKIINNYNSESPTERKKNKKKFVQ
jgi:hypothetical protein